jgi:hypothetical protein
MDTAPKDGRFVATLNGGNAVTFAYFENRKWFAPFDANNEALGRSEIFPISWVDIPTPTRN